MSRIIFLDHIIGPFNPGFVCDGANNDILWFFHHYKISSMLPGVGAR